MRRALAIAAALAGAGCSFSYQNPAEDLRPGQVRGRVVSAASGTVTPAANVSVGLRNGVYDQVTRDTGTFTYLKLPPGAHTLVFRLGAGLTVQRTAEVGYGRDGQPEGVMLGDVVLVPSVSVTGTVEPPPSGLGGAYDCDVEGYVVDEVSGQRAFFSGCNGYRFQFGALEVGEHRFRAAAREYRFGGVWAGGPAVLRLGLDAAGTTRELTPIPLADPSGDPGRIRFRVQLVGAAAGTSLSGVGVSIFPPPIVAPTIGSDGTVEVEADEGLYAVSITAPSSAAAAGAPYSPGALSASVFAAPPEQRFVVLPGQVADLGSLYLVAEDVVTEAQYACTSDADCGATGTCQGGTCQGYTPPASAGAALEFCDVPFGEGQCATGYNVVDVGTGPFCGPLCGCCTDGRQELCQTVCAIP